MSEKKIILILCCVTAAVVIFTAGYALGDRSESSFIAYDPPSVPAHSTVTSQPAESAETSEAVFPIDLNTASAEELEALPGIGETTAKNILAYRAEHGFTMIEELLYVDGIGEKKFAAIRELVTIGK